MYLVTVVSRNGGGGREEEEEEEEGRRKKKRRKEAHGGGVGRDEFYNDKVRKNTARSQFQIPVLFILYSYKCYCTLSVVLYSAIAFGIHPQLV